MNFLIKRAFLVMAGLCSCVGTDYLDDLVVGERITVTDETLALLPNNQAQVSAEYFNAYGVKQDVALQWSSSDAAVAEVNNAGLITAKTDGQTIVQPFVGNFFGPQIQITVESDPTAVATVTITASVSTNISVGTAFQLQAVVKNVFGEIITGEFIEWFSENNTILTVNSAGAAEAVGSGIAGIHAKVNGVKSSSIDFTVTGFVRNGTFVSAGGYQATGTARLELVDQQLILTLSNDFNTDFALGTYVYLANSTNGSTVRASGFEVAQIFTDGGKTFNISQLNGGIGLSTYRYVIILCKPATVTFGFADMN